MEVGGGLLSCNNKKSKLIPIIRLVKQRLLFVCKPLDTDDEEQVEKVLNNKKRWQKDDTKDNSDGDIEEDLVLDSSLLQKKIINL